MISRRRFAALLAALAALGAGAALVLRGRLGRLAGRKRSDGFDPGAPTGALPAGTMTTLLAFGEVLLPTALPYAEGDAGGAGSPRDVLARALDQLATGEQGYRAEFLRAAARLEGTPAGPFAPLALEDRRRAAEPLLRPGSGDDRLWRYVAAPLIEAFYRSPYGWRLVGYPRGPGECSDLVGYQSPPAGAA